MKKTITLSIILFTLYLHSSGQTKADIVNGYLSNTTNSIPTRLNHGPVPLSVEGIDKASLFFVSEYDSIHDNFYLQGVVYYKASNLYTAFEVSEFDPSFGKGVITVFFENIDDDSEKEMLLIVDNACRTFYTDGGYAEIRPFYQTKVFNIDQSKNSTSIWEYKAIGELLTVNTPALMGRRSEEQIMGRESMKLDKVLDVTSNAAAVKRRILMLKENGLLK